MTILIRPDGVMRTGVIRPFAGWNPSGNAQAIAQAFTTGGPLATTLGGLSSAGPIANWWAGVKARWADRKMAKAIMSGAIQQTSPGPESTVGNQVAPQMQHQMQMLMALTQTSNSYSIVGPVAQASRALAARRWNTYYRDG